MPKTSPKLVNTRREEIIAACRELYKTRSFCEITIKDIGSVTTCTRTSIYNYFQTKEEIFLAMHQQEYELWCDELQQILDTHPQMSVESFSDALARSLEHRALLLKLMSMNHYDMEGNSRVDALIAFKQAYGKSLKLVEQCLIQFFPNQSVEQRQQFIYIFFPFLFGIYPYTSVTEKQKNAMKEAGIKFSYQTIYQISKKCIQALLASQPQ